MQQKDRLYQTLDQIDSQGYKSYKKLQKNWYDFKDFKLGIPYVQGDPYARPSSIFIRLSADKAGFKNWYYKNNTRIKAVEDYLSRKISSNISKFLEGHRGSGKSGLITIASPGQEVIKRTSLEFTPHQIEARIKVGLPARGRTVMGYQAQDMFFQEIPKIVKNSLYFKNIEEEHLRNHVETVEEQTILRKKLRDKNLVSFIANGSILPRKSGISDRPMNTREAVPFSSPCEEEVEFELPYSGKISGLGIRKGITLIVGGGYHGKSTLLEAVARGVYDHIPGDGREYVVTRKDAVKIRAEDGRRIEKVNISPFINNLPGAEKTREFSSENASGSTSQAANIIEALELGTGLLLIDEDTSATNLMIRDARMQQLVSKDKEPITPFIDQVEKLYKNKEISTLLVVGGAGDYFDVADRVIMMDEYRPRSATNQAQEIARNLPSQRQQEEGRQFSSLSGRIPDPDSFNPRKGRKIKVRPRGRETIQFGRENIDLSSLEQLLDQGQTKAIGDILVYALKNDIIDGKRSLSEILTEIYNRLENEGLKTISPFQPDGDYVLPRPQETGAAINRLRSLKIK